MKVNIHFWSYLAHFSLEWEMFHPKVVEEIKNTYFVFGKYFRKSWLLWDKVEKLCRAGQATDDNMAHVHYMLHN